MRISKSVLSYDNTYAYIGVMFSEDMIRISIKFLLIGWKTFAHAYFNHVLTRHNSGITMSIRRTQGFWFPYVRLSHFCISLFMLMLAILRVIRREWAKYRDLSVASRSIIVRSGNLIQIIHLRESGKSRYFAITEFNNFVLSFDRQVFIFQSLYGSLEKRSVIFHPRAWLQLRVSRILFAAKHS